MVYFKTSKVLQIYLDFLENEHIHMDENHYSVEWFTK